MSYSIACYAVELDALQKSCGSDDETLLAELHTKFADQIAENDDWFEEEISDGAPTLGEALSHLIRGEVLDGEHGFQYGYALEVLSNHFGESIEDDVFQSMSGGWFWDLPETIQSLIKAGSPVQIPEIDDFPTVGFKSLQTIKSELAKPDQFKSGTDLAEAYQGYYAILKRCADKSKSLVAFYY